MLRHWMDTRSWSIDDGQRGEKKRKTTRHDRTDTTYVGDCRFYPLVEYLHPFALSSFASLQRAHNLENQMAKITEQWREEVVPSAHQHLMSFPIDFFRANPRDQSVLVRRGDSGKCCRSQVKDEHWRSSGDPLSIPQSLSSSAVHALFCSPSSEHKAEECLRSSARHPLCLMRPCPPTRSNPCWCPRE